MGETSTRWAETLYVVGPLDVKDKRQSSFTGDT